MGTGCLSSLVEVLPWGPQVTGSWDGQPPPAETQGIHTGIAEVASCFNSVVSLSPAPVLWTVYQCAAGLAKITLVNTLGF